MFESSMESMVGIIPVAITAGVVLGVTQKALQMPNQMQSRDEPYRPRRKRRKSGDVWQDLFGVQQ